MLNTMAPVLPNKGVSDEEELKRRGYVLGSLLGEGSYAKVKWAQSEKLGFKVALKIIRKGKAPADFQQKFLPRELEVMKIMNHPNIVKLYEIMRFNDKIVMVMELAGHGDLLEYVKLRGAIPEDKAKAMFSQLINGVEYMHRHNIVHRDLKCENILLDSENNIKLSDFGFSRIQMVDQLSRTYCGSAAYAAPEVLQGIPYHGQAYDIWSLGVILYIMVCGSMPFDDTDVKKMIRYQLERKVAFSRSKKLSDEVRSLIMAIIEPRVERRLTIRAIKDHPWLRASFTGNNGNQSSSSMQAISVPADPGSLINARLGPAGTRPEETNLILVSQFQATPITQPPADATSPATSTVAPEQPTAPIVLVPSPVVEKAQTPRTSVGSGGRDSLGSTDTAVRFDVPVPAIGSDTSHKSPPVSVMLAKQSLEHHDLQPQNDLLDDAKLSPNDSAGSDE